MEKPADDEHIDVSDQEPTPSEERKTIFIDLKGRKRKKKNNNNNNNGTEIEKEQAYEREMKALIAENIELKQMIQAMQEDEEDYMDVTQEYRDKNPTAEQKNQKVQVTENIDLTEMTTKPKGNATVNKQNSTPEVKKVETRIFKNKNGGPPAFIVYNINHKLIKNKLIEILKNDNLTLQIINQNVTKLRVSTSSDHTQVKNFLKNEKINFFTYTPKDLKPYTLFINGIPNCYEEQEVNEAIGDLNISANIIKIQKLKNSFLLQVDRETDIEQLKQIKYLLHCKVSISDAKKKRFLQCKNCQRYSHSASNCNMPYRCVKCGESHGPGNCKIPPKEKNIEEVLIKNPNTGEIIKKIGIPVKCINCNVEGHTANAPICPKRIELMKRFTHKRDEMKMKDVIPTNYVKSSVSFAAVVGKKPANNIKNFNQINVDCQEIFGKDFFRCMAQIGEFNETYSTLRTPEEKTKALFNLFISLKLNG